MSSLIVIIINSIRDDNRFKINSVKLLYSLPINTFTLINDVDDKIYLAKIKNYIDMNIDKNSEIYISYASKENSKMRNSILESYDFYLNDKYKININQKAINNVKNLFQW